MKIIKIMAIFLLLVGSTFAQQVSLCLQAGEGGSSIDTLAISPLSSISTLSYSHWGCNDGGHALIIRDITNNTGLLSQHSCVNGDPGQTLRGTISVVAGHSYRIELRGPHPSKCPGGPVGCAIWSASPPLCQPCDDL